MKFGNTLRPWRGVVTALALVLAAAVLVSAPAVPDDYLGSDLGSIELVAASFGVGATIGSSASGSATVSVEIIAPLELVGTPNLDFGMIRPGSGGTVTVHPMNPDSPTMTGAVTMIAAAASAAAQFTASGAPGTNVTITLPTASASNPMVIADPANHQMNVHSFTHSAGASPTFDDTGSLVFLIGATLDVSPGQSNSSLYTGQFDVLISSP